VVVKTHLRPKKKVKNTVRGIVMGVKVGVGPNLQFFNSYSRIGIIAVVRFCWDFGKRVNVFKGGSRGLKANAAKTGTREEYTSRLLSFAGTQSPPVSWGVSDKNIK